MQVPNGTGQGVRMSKRPKECPKKVTAALFLLKYPNVLNIVRAKLYIQIHRYLEEKRKNIVSPPCWFSQKSANFQHKDGIFEKKYTCILFKSARS